MSSMFSALLPVALFLVVAACNPAQAQVTSYRFTSGGHGAVEYFEYTNTVQRFPSCTCRTRQVCQVHVPQDANGTWVYDQTTGRTVFLPNTVVIRSGTSSPFPQHQFGDPHAPFRSTFGMSHHNQGVQNWPGSSRWPSWNAPQMGNAIGFNAPSTHSQTGGFHHSSGGTFQASPSTYWITAP